MKIQILTIITALFLIATVSAANQTYSGDSYVFPSEEFEYYTVVGNQSNIEGMIIDWENGNTTVSFSPLFKSDGFTIVFFNEKVVTNTVTVGGSSGGGGGGSRKVIYRDKIITEIFEGKGEDNIVKEKEIVIEKQTVETNRVPLWSMISFWILLGLLIIFAYLALSSRMKEGEEDDNTS